MARQIVLNSLDTPNLETIVEQVTNTYMYDGDVVESVELTPIDDDCIQVTITLSAPTYFNTPTVETHEEGTRRERKYGK